MAYPIYAPGYNGGYFGGATSNLAVKALVALWVVGTIGLVYYIERHVLTDGVSAVGRSIKLLNTCESAQLASSWHKGAQGTYSLVHACYSFCLIFGR